MDQTYTDFTVISLSDSGTERWCYRYDGPGISYDEAHSIVAAAGNIYAAGYSGGVGTSKDLTVISLTDSGTERWVYRYNGPGNGDDVASSIVAGADGNIYVAGYSVGSGTDKDFTVIGLTSSGVERWVYRYNGPANSFDEAYSMVTAADGRIYAAGFSYGAETQRDLLIASLNDSGAERWVYRYDGPVHGNDWATSLVAAADGSIYASASTGYAVVFDFAVISLTDSGTERWMYRYDGPASRNDEAHSIFAGADGNVYAAGCSDGVGTHSDFTVVGLTPSGVELWVYRYNSPGNGYDVANSLVCSVDGNVYAAGVSWYDFVVISLTAESGIADLTARPAGNPLDLAVSTVRNHALAYTLRLSTPALVSLSLYDLHGRKIASWHVPAPKGTSQHYRSLPALSSGVYILSAEIHGGRNWVRRKFVILE